VRNVPYLGTFPYNSPEEEIPLAKIKSTTVANDTNIFVRRITVERPVDFGPERGTGMKLGFVLRDAVHFHSIQHPEVEAQVERILRSKGLNEADKFDILRALFFGA
jgi:hypothetical protein